MSSISRLYALQETDLAIDSLRQRLSGIISQLGEWGELKALRGEVDRRRHRLEGLRRQQRDLELEVGGLRDKAKAVERKLYGGEVRNPKELQSLNDDLHALMRQISHKEDMVLQLMLEVEEEEKALQEAQARLSSLLEEWEREQEALTSEKTKLEQELGRLEEVRAGQARQVDPPLLALYEELRSRRQGRAIARVERGLCGGCHIALPTYLVQRARAGNAPVQCTSCERILFVG